MVHTSQNIPLMIKSVRHEISDCISIIFKRPIHFMFNAGDWIDLGFANENIKGGITYSLSSAPTEPDLMITFRSGVSEVKRTLESLKEGDKLRIVQYGNDYGFHLREHATATLIAGGVGIAPFRSMLKEMFDTGNKSNVELLYFNSTEDFLFAPEINQWKSAMPHFSVRYVVTKGLKKKDKNQILASLIDTSKRTYYIAGPEAMVESTEHLLIDHGVKLSEIKIDSFGGY